MVLRIRHSSLTTLLPGLLTGMLLGIVQSLLVALIPVEINAVFALLLALIFLLYLLVPFYTRFHMLRRREPVPGAARIAMRIGGICAILVTLSTIITCALSLSGIQVVESGGFLGFRLMADNFSSLIAIILLNTIGLLLSLLGGWFGGILGARWIRGQEEQLI